MQTSTRSSPESTTPPFDVLTQFGALRNANLRLARQLTPADLARFGIHTERGGESAGYLLRLMAGHDIVHLAQLARIRAAVLPL